MPEEILGIPFSLYKQFKLEKKFGMRMTEVVKKGANSMCNYSDFVEEQGILKDTILIHKGMLGEQVNQDSFRFRSARIPADDCLCSQQFYHLSYQKGLLC